MSVESVIKATALEIRDAHVRLTTMAIFMFQVAPRRSREAVRRRYAISSGEWIECPLDRRLPGPSITLNIVLDVFRD